MSQVLQSFLPFIVGCHGSMCDYTQFPRDVVLVDLDRRMITGCGLPWPELPADVVYVRESCLRNLSLHGFDMKLERIFILSMNSRFFAGLMDGFVPALLCHALEFASHVEFPSSFCSATRQCAAAPASQLIILLQLVAFVCTKHAVQIDIVVVLGLAFVHTVLCGSR